MLTHHLPSKKLIHKAYNTAKYTKYQERYYSHSDDILTYPITNSICGHSHCITDTYINGVNVSMNSLEFNDLNLKNSKSFINLD